MIHSPEETEEEETAAALFDKAAIDTTLQIEKKTSLPGEWFMGKIPWDLDLSLHYTSNRYNPNNPSETFRLNATVDASITKNWQISYHTYVDLVDHDVVSAGLTIYRNLHCWEARMVWHPLGIGQG